MSADRLLEYYHRVADAPDATKRLRSLVLELAVRGKLVPQHPDDETASALMRKIDSERSRLANVGLIKSTHFESPESHELPFPIPITWTWTRLGAVGDWGSGSTPPRTGSDLYGGMITWLKSGELNDNRCLIGSEEQITEHALTTGSFRINRRGDVLIAMYGATIGRIAILGEDAVTNQAVCGCTPFPGVFNAFMFTFLLSQRARFQAASEGGAQPNISKIKIIRTLFPLPPLDEQHRIVKKVDELMALCDEIEAQRAKRETTRDRFSIATLAHLNAPDPNAVVVADHARFAIQSLEVLTTRRDQIKRLRQTIINLAVSGNLVRQDPGEEPIEVALPSDSARPGLPAKWRQARLADLLAEDTRNGYSRKPDDVPDGTPILRISAGTVRSDGVVAEEEHKLIGGITAEVRLQYGLKRGDLVACRFNGNKAFVGRLAIFADYLDIQPIYPDKLIRIRVASKCAVPEYIRLASTSDIVATEIEAFCATTVGNWGISATNLKEVKFPVPPVGEQRRIVTKVNQLMALCTQLEASLTTEHETRGRLLDALVAEALTTADPEAVLAIG